MRFAFIDTLKKIWSIEFLCGVLQVPLVVFVPGEHGLSAKPNGTIWYFWAIREQHRLSLQSYGRLRITEELQELRKRRKSCLPGKSNDV